MFRSIVGEFRVRKKIIPGYGVPLDEAPQEIPQGAVGDFALSVRLWVKSCWELKRRAHQAPESFPEASGETHIAVGDDAAGNAVETYHFVEEELGSVWHIRSLGASDKVRHLAKKVDDH